MRPEEHDEHTEKEKSASTNIMQNITNVRLHSILSAQHLGITFIKKRHSTDDFERIIASLSQL